MGGRTSHSRTVSLMIFFVLLSSFAHEPFQDPFRQLEEILPTPNQMRTATGHPGTKYWQQKADYVIDVELETKTHRIIGTETITYHNNSPDHLPYLWLQLDQNYLAASSNREKVRSAPHMASPSIDTLSFLRERKEYDGQIDISAVFAEQGEDLPHRIVGTMMRIDLPTALAPQERVVFSVEWNYEINDASKINARTGYERLEENGAYIYEVAQWFPRMASYTDVHGWHHKQSLGRGEFTLEFGDYDVSITVPANHIVAATGVLTNPQDVLSDAQQKRLQTAQKAKKPVLIVPKVEAEKNINSKTSSKKTWTFSAENVRDFAFASSSTFLWDAWGRDIDSKTVMAMSFFPSQAEPLWSTYSTHAVAHTLEVYSRLLFPYPYPVAISVNGPIRGMEYPMICFNGPRPLEDGSYIDKSGNGHRWMNSKYGLISVIIHEVGHNWFPMIINSDERSWTWMDEGLNSFVQHIAHVEWEENYPNTRGEPDSILRYMKSTNQVPIMTNSESLLQFGSNAYAKPASAMHVLRETILGREVFDDAFQAYAKAWKFKRPMPADFFRIMEDVSGTDLDWFWQTWFYSTAHIDVSVSSVRHIKLIKPDPKSKKAQKKKKYEERPISSIRKKAHEHADFYIDRYREDLEDFYSTYDPYSVSENEEEEYKKIFEELSKEEQKAIDYDQHLSVITLENIGGGLTPVVLQVLFDDESTKEIRLPAEIWRHNSKRYTKLLHTEKKITAVELDPHHEMADTDKTNNRFPRTIEEEPAFITLPKAPKKNPMQQSKEDEEKKDEDAWLEDR